MARHARTRLPIYYIIILRLATLSEIINQIKIHTFKTSIETKNITTNTEKKLNTNELRYLYKISTHFLGIKRVEKHLNLFI